MKHKKSGKEPPAESGAKAEHDHLQDPHTRPEKPPFLGGWDQAIPVAGLKETEGRPEPEGEAPKKNSRELPYSGGTIHLENYCGAETLAGLTVDDGIVMFSRNNPERQKKALLNVSESNGGNVIVGVHEGRLVSYIGIHVPSEKERWGKPGYPWLIELGAIEVSRNYRRVGLAESMLDVGFDDPFYEDKVVLTTGFTWHWDLEGTGLDKMEYRLIGIELFGRYGFMEMVTDEPNVTMDSANLFLVRIGKNVSFSRYQKFASLLFANEWEAMLRGL